MFAKRPLRAAVSILLFFSAGYVRAADSGLLSSNAEHQAYLEKQSSGLVASLRTAREQAGKASLYEQLKFLDQQVAISKNADKSDPALSQLYLAWFSATSGMLPVGGPDPRVYMECIDKHYKITTALMCEDVTPSGEDAKYVKLNLQAFDGFLSWLEKQATWNYLGELQGAAFESRVRDNGEGKDCVDIRITNFNDYPVTVRYAFAVGFESAPPVRLEVPVGSRHKGQPIYLVDAKSALPAPGDYLSLEAMDRLLKGHEKDAPAELDLSSGSSCFPVRANGHVKGVPSIAGVSVKRW